MKGRDIKIILIILLIIFLACQKKEVSDISSQEEKMKVNSLNPVVQEFFSLLVKFFNI